MNEKPCANKHVCLKMQEEMVPVHHKGKRQILSQHKKNCGGKNNSDLK